MIARPSVRFRDLAALAVSLGAAGCAGGPSTYPSLAPRAVEQRSLAEPVRPAPPPAVASPEAVARFAPLIEKAHTADAAFRKTLEEERSALERGRGAAVGSDAWTAAQTALTRVETSRGGIARLLADLDAARNTPETEADTGVAIAAAQAFDTVQQIDDRETRDFQAIWPG
jgi:hypothetical protein